MGFGTDHFDLFVYSITICFVASGIGNKTLVGFLGAEELKEDWKTEYGEGSS